MVLVLAMPPALLLVVDALLTLVTEALVGPAPLTVVLVALLAFEVSEPSVEPAPPAVDEVDPALGSISPELQAASAISALGRPSRARRTELAARRRVMARAIGKIEHKL